jgi:hypothetical protein
VSVIILFGSKFFRIAANKERSAKVNPGDSGWSSTTTASSTTRFGGPSTPSGIAVTGKASSGGRASDVVKQKTSSSKSNTGSRKASSSNSKNNSANMSSVAPVDAPAGLPSHGGRASVVLKKLRPVDSESSSVTDEEDNLGVNDKDAVELMPTKSSSEEKETTSDSD